MPAEVPESVKSQIVARLMEILDPLKADQTFRLIERKTTFFLLEAIAPALHVIVGPEDVVEEDNRGYTKEFSVFFKIITEQAADPYGLADRTVAFLQRVIEADVQLDGLCNSIKYAGDQPFTSEELKNSGGNMVSYTIQYRRERGKPEGLY